MKRKARKRQRGRTRNLILTLVAASVIVLVILAAIFYWTIPFLFTPNTTTNQTSSFLNATVPTQFYINLLPANVTVSIASARSQNVTKFDLDQGIAFTTSVSGGTGPFTYNFIISRTDSNRIVSTSGSIPSKSFLYTTNNTGRFQANIIVSAGYNQSTNSTYSTVFVVNPTPKVVLSANPGSPSAGQKETLTASLSGGTGPFTVNFVYANNGVLVQSVQGVQAGGTAAYVFNPPAGTYRFRALATDIGTLKPYAFGSSTLTLKVTH